MAQSNLAQMNKFPSVQSIHSMVSLGYLPPGHGYIPKKVKPDKPYGPSYITTLNRTWRGPGRRCLQYALTAACLALFFYISAALYFAHRNVSRMIVRHSEPLGACLLIVAILLTAGTFYFIYNARMASNRWRYYLRFHPDGLFHVQPVNDEYSPKDPTKLTTGTYGPRAVKEIPKPKYMKKSRPASRAGGRKRGPPMLTLQEGDEDVLVEDEPSNVIDGLDGPQTFMADMPQVHKPNPIRLGQPEVMPQAPQIVPLDRMPTQMRATPEPFYPQGRATPGMDRMPPGMDRMPPRQMSDSRPPPGMDRMPPGMDRMPPGMDRMPPGMDRMPAQAPEPRYGPSPERMPPGGRAYTPEPRMVPGSGRQPPAQERMVPGSRPEPRMIPGQGRHTPEPRMVPGQARQAPEPRMTPGQGRQAPEPRMIPGQGRQTPEPRMIPGQGRQAPEPRMIPGQGRQAPEPRMVPGQGRQTPTPRMVPGSQGRPPAGRGRPPPTQGRSDDDL